MDTAMKGYTCFVIFMTILYYVQTYDLEMLFQKAMRNIFRGKKHVQRLLLFSEFFKKHSVLLAIKDRRQFFARRFLDLICRLVEKCATEEAETARALLDSYEYMYYSYKLFLNDDFSQKTIKDLHEEYYEEMKKIIEQLRRIYLLRHSRYVKKILESLLLEVIDATNNYQGRFIDIIDNKGLIANVFMETKEIYENSFDYFDDTVLRFRIPTTHKQSTILPKMSAINHSHHGRLLTDYWQFQYMRDCPFYTVHHPYFGNNTYSVFTHSNLTSITVPSPTFKFKADEEETLEQTWDRPRLKGKESLYLGPKGIVTEEPIIPYEVMQQIFGKYSNWDYYRSHKESQNTKKNGIKKIRTTNLPMYKIIYDIKDLPHEKVADFIEDNNLALNKTFPYFMAEDIFSNLYVEQEHSISLDFNTTDPVDTYPPHFTFCNMNENELEMFFNKTGISLKPQQYPNDSQESQVLKRFLETTTATRKLKPQKHGHDSKESNVLRRILNTVTTATMLKIPRRQSKTTNDKEYQLPKRQKSTSIPFKFPLLSMTPMQVSSENRMTQDVSFDSMTTTSKTPFATFYKRRVKILFEKSPYDIPTSKKPIGIFDIYRSFEVEYSQETTPIDLEIDAPEFNITHYKNLRTSGERNEYHRQYVIEYLKFNDELLQLNYKYSKNKTSNVHYYNYINSLKRINFEDIGKFDVNGTAEQLLHEIWKYEQRKKYSTTTNVAITLN